VERRLAPSGTSSAPGVPARRYGRDVAALVIVVVVLSGALGLLAQRRLARPGRTESQDSAEGIPLTDLLAPVRILVALVLAFVLVQTFTSYEDASDAANDEAGAVSTEAVAAALLPSPSGPDLVARLRCYARAVAGPGWTSLEATRRTSSISNDADARVMVAVAQAEQADISETLVAEVVAADRARAAARRVRLAEAAPSVPGIVTALLIGSVAVTVASTAALADRRIRPSLRWTLLGITTLIFTASLLVILDLDRPFGGVAQIEPTAMRSVEQQIGTTPFGANPPCDQSGVPLAGS
jgi:hypothetical protein